MRVSYTILFCFFCIGVMMMIIIEKKNIYIDMNKTKEKHCNDRGRAKHYPSEFKGKTAGTTSGGKK